MFLSSFDEFFFSFFVMLHFFTPLLLLSCSKLACFSFRFTCVTIAHFTKRIVGEFSLFKDCYCCNFWCRRFTHTLTILLLTKTTTIAMMVFFVSQIPNPHTHTHVTGQYIASYNDPVNHKKVENEQQHNENYSRAYLNFVIFVVTMLEYMFIIELWMISTKQYFRSKNTRICVCIYDTPMVCYLCSSIFHLCLKHIE